MPLSSCDATLSIAPMIDWTYRYFRVLMRMLAPRALLYTEMQTLGALTNNPARALAFDAMEQPLALQVGGADVADLVAAAKLAEASGFVEINLNLGCPSDRVQAGRFGACLMREPEHVAECIAAMKDAVSIPVTAKTRIGVDHDDDYEHFEAFARHLFAAGCDKLIVHARKAWLSGLNPKQNRTIPPLHYDYVHRIKRVFPNQSVVINGNIKTLPEVLSQLLQVDGVMLGRLACDDPYHIARIHHGLYPDSSLPTREDILRDYGQFVASRALLMPLSWCLKPILNLAHALPSARAWKARVLTLHDFESPAFANVVAHLADLEQQASQTLAFV